MIAPHQPGSHVKVTVVRDKQTRELDVSLIALEDKTEASGGAQPSSPGAPTAPSSLGIGVAEQDGQVVVQRVVPDGPSEGKLRPGDVVESINQEPVKSAADLQSKVRAAALDKPVLLRVKRGDQSRFVAIERSPAR
jgi:serine protease Do